MAKKPSADACKKAVTLRKNGEKWPVVLKATGLNYSQAWLAVYHQIAIEQKLVVPENQRTAATVARLYDDEKQSWGWIMVRFGYHPANPNEFTHGHIRALYEEGTGQKSQGQRVGHGGRFYGGKSGEALYRGGSRQKDGVQIEKGLKKGQVLDLARNGALDPTATRIVAGANGEAVAATGAGKKVRSTRKQAPAKATPTKATPKKAGVVAAKKQRPKKATPKATEKANA